MTKEISNTYRTLVDTPIDQAAEEERNRHIAKLFDGLLPRAEVEILKLRTRCEEQEKVIEMAREALEAANECIKYYSHPGSMMVSKALAAMKEKP